MNTTLKALLWVAALVAVAWAGYSWLGADSTQPAGESAATSTAPVAAEPIKIGISAPVTGEAASIGEAFVAGARLAEKEINEAGGINGRLITLIVEDDQCTSKGVNAITKLVQIDKVAALVGPVCSAAAGPGLPVAQAGSVPTLVVGSAPHLTKIGDYIFRHYPSDAFQGKFAAEYIFNGIGKKKVAVIYTNNDWGKGISDVFAETFKTLGGTVLLSEGVAQDTKDFRTLITKVKAVKPDVVYFPTYPANGAAGLKQMKEAGIKVPIIGGDGWEGEEIYRIAEAEGALFTAAKAYNPDEFKSRVKAATGVDATIYTVYGYDGIKIMAHVMRTAGTDGAVIKDALAKLSYTEGVSAPVIEFDSQGDLKTPAFEVRIIKRGKSEPYSG
jgi:branched-chain amino acid transport system substrate-binding protein